LVLIRNAIMHDAEIRHQWLIAKTVPRGVILQENKNGEYRLNRIKFHEALSEIFEEWIANLRHGDVALRANMRERMDQIIENTTK
jgi:hypothetical protein